MTNLEEQNPTITEWKLLTHSHELADTGDYSEVEYEITNGAVSIFTADEGIEEAIEPIIKALNDCDCTFYLNDDTDWELSMLRQDNEKMLYMIENGFNWEDMKTRMYPKEYPPI